ncbi:MAG: OmpA family protein [Rhodobacteraceae bacterium]|jgi:outer membrane protein OmpA-like peptidoglycan-associated protein|nr:OmpA family protein [Paracoccaceae bacterium]
MTIGTKILAGSAAALILAGCVDTAGSPVDNPRTRQGAVVGALAGAALGASRSGSNDLEQAAAGAVIGGIAGAVVGNILDAQARELDRDLSGNIDVIRDGDRLIVRMPNDLLFGVDSTFVRPDLQRDLSILAGSLNKYPRSTIEVVGHADSDGSDAYNQDLSERRASAVASILVNEGVSSRRVVAYGRGETQPIASNATPAGKQANRRVEIIIRETR